ncbi:[FeFe] hydrogenase, group A [Clostridium felsineum]|uniref:[FeFe] hydrogenase, group A n=1 Tax=Clostridium felsineum TaxID=36839 RepID=UPI00098BF2DB|nr:[FeFe] hydrogenase, group A [Clostridium felsineum]URZ16625.1 NAD(P)H-quinone oxidoreductase subunit I, chloroplastic [Clostridium felsineum DSM 794]
MSKSKKISRIQSDNIIQINKKKCIGCTGCAIACAEKTGISVLKAIDEGRRTVIPKQGTFSNTGCIYCGQCTLICPTTAINVRNDINVVKEALTSGKYLVSIAAPSLKATLGEEFNLPIGTNVEGKIAASARKLGIQKVFETDFGADMTILEEGTELIKRISTKEKLPMFTSCCPAWVRYAELFHPKILNYLSTAKSPQQMMGAAIKTYFADTFKILPKNIFTISIKPCTAKKYEAEKPNMGRDDYKDIDVVLTIREYAELLKEKGININAIPSEKADSFMGDYTGGAIIFGASGGVMESTLRTVTYYLKGDLSKVYDIKFTPVDAYTSVKEAQVIINNEPMKVAVISGLYEMDKFLSSDKWREYVFIEVMACPGGCVNGGGTPRIEKKSQVNENKCIACGTCIENCPVGAIAYNINGRAETNKNKCVGCTLCSKLCRTKTINIEYYDKATGKVLDTSYIDLRRNVLRQIDKNLPTRISAENPELQDMYKNYMGDPDGKKAESLLHTSYEDKSSELKAPLKRQSKRHK